MDYSRYDLGLSYHSSLCPGGFSYIATEEMLTQDFSDFPLYCLSTICQEQFCLIIVIKVSCKLGYKILHTVFHCGFLFSRYSVELSFSL